MMRLAVAFAALAALCAPALADEVPASNNYYGVKLGVNATTLFGNGARDAELDLGLGLGAFYAHELFENFRLAPEFLMTEKGAAFESITGDSADEGFLYLQLPVLARYDLPLSRLITLFGFAGPGFGYVIHSDRMPKSDLFLFDISGMGGIGVDINPGSHRILVDLRGEVGFLNQLDREDNRSARNLGMSLFAGVSM